MPEYEEPLEVQEAPPGRLYCFLHPERVCSSDCISFDVGREQGMDSCRALRSLDRLVYFASLAYKVYSDRVQDAQRASSAPYVSVDPITGRPL